MRILLLITSLILSNIAKCQVEEMFIRSDDSTIVSHYYINDAGKMTGRQKIYYPNGSLMQEQEWENDFLVGRMFTYSENGDTIAFGNVLNNYIMYYSIDSLLVYESGLVEGGEYNGFFKSYHKDGKINNVYYFENGVKHDNFVLTFDDKGCPLIFESEFPIKIINSKTCYLKNVEVSTPTGHGLQFIYDEGGIYSLCFLLNGARHGISIIYKNGNMVNKILFNKGVVLLTEGKFGLEKFNIEKHINHPKFWDVIGAKNIFKFADMHKVYQNSF